MEDMIVPGIVVVIVAAIAVCAVVYYASDEIVTVTVDEKWTKYHSGDAKYLFSDEKGIVYSMEDSLLLWKFDASNRYASIESGKSYEITTYGWRIPVLSWYKNVVSVREVSI